MKTNELTFFFFEKTILRTVIVGNDIHFVAKDVCDILGYSNANDAINRHCKGVVKHDTLTSGGIQTVSCLPERDVYRLIMRSKLPSAEKFENWVVDEVLPSIRKTGGYLNPVVDFTDPDNIMRLLENWKADREKLESANKALKEQKPKVEFYDTVTESKNAIDMATCAKVLNLGIGRNLLFEFLRNKKVLQDNNQPYQKYVDMGLFRVIEQKYTKPSGETNINIKTVVYQKGLDYIRKLYTNETESK